MYQPSKQEFLEKLWPRFLQTVSKGTFENPIKAQVIAALLECTIRQVAELTNYGIEHKKILISTNTLGYYVPQDRIQAELDLHHLREREIALNKRILLSEAIIEKMPVTGVISDVWTDDALRDLHKGEQIETEINRLIKEC